MSVSAINQLSQGSLPPSISGGILPPAIAQDQGVQAAQQQQVKEDVIEAKYKPLQDAADAETDKSAKALQGVMDKGPDKVPMPENKAQHMDPKVLSDSFSSFMALGALAGLLTKTPMTAALNNMTAAINGVQAGDEQQYQRSYKEFQDNFKKATEANDAKLEEYKTVFNNAKTTLDEKMREARLVATKYGDELGKAQHSYTEMSKAIQSATLAGEKAKEQKQQLDHWHQEHMDKMTEMSEHERHDKAEEARLGQEKTGTLDFKLNELDRMKTSGEINEQEAAARRKTLLEGTRGVHLGEERAYAQGIQLKLANKEIKELTSKGVEMPFAGDIHIDSGGVPSAVGRLGLRRSLTDEEQQIVTAAQLYAEAAGHIQSGARLTQAAFDRSIREFIPMKGDKPGNIAEKQAHRDAMESGVSTLSGPLADKASAPQVPGAEETKNIGGVNYHKVNGQWMQE